MRRAAPDARTTTGDQDHLACEQLVFKNRLVSHAIVLKNETLMSIFDK
jgi:hypothetical protein